MASKDERRRANPPHRRSLAPLPPLPLLLLVLFLLHLLLDPRRSPCPPRPRPAPTSQAAARRRPSNSSAAPPRTTGPERRRCPAPLPSSWASPLPRLAANARADASPLQFRLRSRPPRQRGPLHRPRGPLRSSTTPTRRTASSCSTKSGGVPTASSSPRATRRRAGWSPSRSSRGGLEASASV